MDVTANVANYTQMHVGTPLEQENAQEKTADYTTYWYPGLFTCYKLLLY